jgi:hypothetical protein
MKILRGNYGLTLESSGIATHTQQAANVDTDTKSH